MANYAVGPLPQTQVSYPGLNQSAQSIYENSPQLGYQYWLNQLNPSQDARRALGNLYDQIYGQYLNQTLTNPLGNHTDWLGYLQQLNTRQQLDALSPDQRYENPARFFQPMRVISF